MRKKWTEAEERSLIDKYGEMISDGTLSKMKTREKKYKPIALHVNSVHHLVDPITYPWEWSWKDVSNKVQNMRHQYSLVKQKIKSSEEGFDWVEGLTHWSNFLRYKNVFGDVTLPYGNGYDEEAVEFGNIGHSSGGDYQNGVMGLEFDYDGNGNGNGNGNENENGNHVYGTRKLRKAEKNLEKKAREMEACFEQREEEEMTKAIKRLREQRNQEWEAMENERRRRREEELVQERKWEERKERRRSEWNARIDEMLSDHRAEMAQFQARILDEQQNLTSQLLGIVSQHPSGITDNTNAAGHYLSQMMQNLQHVGGMLDGDAQVEGHNQEDEFIVDG